MVGSGGEAVKFFYMYPSRRGRGEAIINRVFNGVLFCFVCVYMCLCKKVLKKGVFTGIVSHSYYILSLNLGIIYI